MKSKKRFRCGTVSRLKIKPFGGNEIRLDDQYLKFVNETSLKEVITANEYSDLGYPRNDLLLKEHDELDLILCDLEIYNLAKNSFGSDKKIVVYMPTHRESATSIRQATMPLLPLNLEDLDTFCVQNGIIFILKLHPFIMQFQKDFDSQRDLQMFISTALKEISTLLSSIQTYWLRTTHPFSLIFSYWADQSFITTTILRNISVTWTVFSMIMKKMLQVLK